MIRHILAALVAAPLFLAACEDVPEQVDPTCVSDCDPGETDDTGDPPELVDYAAKTTVNGVEEPCQLRYDSMDSDHKVETTSGTTVGLREECYWLSLNTPNELHTRLSDGVRFIARPTVICVGDAANDERATREWSDLPLDPFFSGSTARCEITHTPSGSFDSWATSNEGNGVETSWMEWDYQPENGWEDPIEVAGDCIDFGVKGWYCFDGEKSIDHWYEGSPLLHWSKDESVVIRPNGFEFTSQEGSTLTSCTVY